MPARDPLGSTDYGESGYLAAHRVAVEHLRRETIAELGPQPMLPEKLSMIAVAVAAMPFVALMRPGVPLQPLAWHVAFTMVTVWLAVYLVQSARYERFHAYWRRKVAAWYGEPDLLQPDTAFA